MKRLLFAVVVALVAGCTVVLEPLPQPDPPIVTWAEPVSPQMCGEPCYVYYRVDVQTTELDPAAFTLMPAKAPKIARTITSNSGLPSSCFAGVCVLIFDLATFHVDGNFYPATLKHSLGGETVITGEL